MENYEAGKAGTKRRMFNEMVDKIMAKEIKLSIHVGGSDQHERVLQRLDRELVTLEAVTHDSVGLRNVIKELQEEYCRVLLGVTMTTASIALRIYKGIELEPELEAFVSEMHAYTAKEVLWRLKMLNKHKGDYVIMDYDEFREMVKVTPELVAACKRGN